MNKLIDFMNKLTDMDSGWWPLVRCRPEKNAYIDAGVLIKITPFFGSVLGMLPILRFTEFRSPIGVLICLAVGWISFFLLYRFTFAVAWNIRADRLNKDTMPPDKVS